MRHRSGSRRALLLVLLLLALPHPALARFLATTFAAGNAFGSDTLDPPTGLVATPSGSNVDLSWTATGDTYASGHRLYRATAPGGPYAQIAQLTPRTATNHTDSPGNGTFYYVARAYHQSWQSANSGEASATVSAGAMATGTYTGNGVDGRAVNGVGFQPDVVFVKMSTADYGVIRTSSMVGDKSKVVTSGALAANLVESLTGDGFTLGSDTNVNANGVAYSWVAFQAAAGQLKVGSYTGNGSDNRSITGVGFNPNIVFTLPDGGFNLRQRWSTMSGDVTYPFGTGGAAADQIQALEADGFQLGTSGNVNSNGVAYHYIAWKAGSNLALGTYTGNGADNRNIGGVGFQPRWMIVKGHIASYAVHRSEQLAGDTSQYFNNVADASDRIQALQASGFQVGTDAEVNGNGTTYSWAAFR